MAKNTEQEELNEIWVNAFTEESATKFRDEVVKISKKDPSAMIVVYIDSYGGYVDSLAKMIDTMDEVSNKFVTVAMGKAMSCGSILLSHGDFRYCTKMSRILIHRVSSAAWGDAYSMKSDTEETLRLNRCYMELLANNCNMTFDELEKLIRSSDGNQIILTAPQAQKFGIVDFVGTPSINIKSYFEVSVTPEKEKIDQDLKKKILKHNKPSTKKPK